MFKKFKKYLQQLSLHDQLYEINEMIQHRYNANIDPIKQIEMIVELKRIRDNLILSQETQNSMNKNSPL